MGKDNDKISGLAKKGNRVVYQNALTKFTVNDGKPNSGYFIALTNYYIAFCDKKQSKFENLIYYDQITSINFADKKIEIGYNKEDKTKKVILESKEIDKINKVIVDYLSKILTQQEAAKLDIKAKEDSTGTDEKCTIPTTRYLVKDHNEDKEKIDTNFLKTLQSHFKVLRITDVDNTDSAFYGVLKDADFIESVELPRFPSLLENNQPLPFAHLLVSGLGDDSFDNFYDSLSQSPESAESNKLTGISLVECKLSDSNLEKLIDLASNNKYVSLSIQKSDIPSSFYQSLEKVEESLQMLNLDHCTVNITELVQYTTFLRSLSISNSNIKIGEFIDDLQNKNFENLEMINLSGNKSGNITFDKKLLPQTLQVVDVSNVQWTKDSLLSFLKLLFEDNYRHGIKLNLGYAQLDDESGWSEIIGYLKNCNPSQLTELNWSGNPISSEFSEFLSKCSNLKILRANLALDKASNLPEFGEAVSQLGSLEEFYAYGSTDHSVGPNIKDFIEKLSGASKLKIIDFHSQKIESDGLQAISELAASINSLETINVDDCNVNNIKELLSFTNSLAKSQRAINVSYLDEEIESLKSKDKDAISSNDIKKLRNNLSQLSYGTATYVEEKGTKKDDENEESKSKDKKKKKDDKKSSKKKSNDKGKDKDKKEEKVPEPPFAIFRIEDKLEFPIYMNKELIKQLDETVPEKEARNLTLEQEDHKPSGNDVNESDPKNKNEEEEDQSDIKHSKSNKNRHLGEDEEEDQKDSKKKSGRKDSKSSKNKRKKQIDDDDDEEEDDEPRKKGRKDSKLSKSNKRKQQYEDDDDEEEESDPRHKSSRKNSKVSKSSKRKRQYEDEEEESSEARSKSSRKNSKASKGSNKRKRQYEDEEEELYEPRKKSSRKDRKQSKSKRQYEDEEEESSEPKKKSSRKSTYKREPRKRAIMDSDSASESESNQSENKKFANKDSGAVSSFAESAPKPKPDQYEQPNWSFPKQVAEPTYDPAPVFKKLQKQYNLNVLRDAI